MSKINRALISVSNKNNLGYDGALLKGIKVAVNQNYKISKDKNKPYKKMLNKLGTKYNWFN